MWCQGRACASINLPIPLQDAKISKIKVHPSGFFEDSSGFKDETIEIQLIFRKGIGGLIFFFKFKWRAVFDLSDLILMFMSALSPTSLPATMLFFFPFTGFIAKLLKTVICTHRLFLHLLLYFLTRLIWFSFHSTEMYLLKVTNYFYGVDPKDIFHPHPTGPLSSIWSCWAFPPTGSSLFLVFLTFFSLCLQGWEPVCRLPS